MQDASQHGHVVRAVVWQHPKHVRANMQRGLHSRASVYVAPGDQLLRIESGSASDHASVVRRAGPPQAVELGRHFLNEFKDIYARTSLATAPGTEQRERRVGVGRVSVSEPAFPLDAYAPPPSPFESAIARISELSRQGFPLPCEERPCEEVATAGRMECDTRKDTSTSTKEDCASQLSEENTVERPLVELGYSASWNADARAPFQTVARSLKPTLRPEPSPRPTRLRCSVACTCAPA